VICPCATSPCEVAQLSNQIANSRILYWYQNDSEPRWIVRMRRNKLLPAYLLDLDIQYDC
jgi:hypothetical protein